MVVELTNVVTLGLTEREKTALQKAYKVLDRLHNELGDYTQLTSLTTGEVVHSKELLRVKGILAGLSENNYFFLEHKVIKDVDL